MTRFSAAALRRANRLMRPVKLAKASRAFQTAVIGMMMDTALAPLKPSKSRPPKSLKPKAPRALKSVLRSMRAAQSLSPAARAAARAAAAQRNTPPAIPTGAQYLSRRHSSPSGSRGYKLYIPASQSKSPKGLILMLHGCNQSPNDFALGTHMNTLAEKNGLVVAYPAQTVRQNAASCWNWFKPENQVRGAGEPALLASLTRKLMIEFELTRDSVFVAGLSAGGAMAAILADAYPDIFAAAGVHSGLARGAASDVISAMGAMRRGGAPNGITSTFENPAKTPVRRIIFHGDADSTVHPANAQLIVTAALGADAVATRVGKRSVRGRGYERHDFSGPDGSALLELWMLKGAGHAWSGGRAAGSFTDGKGPDASANMIRFFLAKSA